VLISSGTLGFMFLLAICFTLGDLSTILASPTGQPLPQIFLEATGSKGAAFGLFFLSTPRYSALRAELTPVLVIGLSCGLACSQATSRCIWA